MSSSALSFKFSESPLSPTSNMNSAAASARKTASRPCAALWAHFYRIDGEKFSAANHSHLLAYCRECVSAENRKLVSKQDTQFSAGLLQTKKTASELLVLGGITQYY